MNILPNRRLCLILGKKGYNALVLFSGTAAEIDKFTVQFDNSEQIRAYFKHNIDPYLISEQKIISSIELKTGRKYRGSIALLQDDFEWNYNPKRNPQYIKENTLIKKRVLYKQDILTALEAIRDEKIMKLALYLDSPKEDKLKNRYPYKGYNLMNEIKHFLYQDVYPTEEALTRIYAWFKDDPKTMYEKARVIIQAHENIMLDQKSMNKYKQLTEFQNEQLVIDGFFNEEKKPEIESFDLNTTSKKEIIDYDKIFSQKKQEILNNKRAMKHAVFIDTNGLISPTLNYPYKSTYIGYRLMPEFIIEVIYYDDYPSKENLKHIEEWLNSNPETKDKKITLLVQAHQELISFNEVSNKNNLSQRR